MSHVCTGLHIKTHSALSAAESLSAHCKPVPFSLITKIHLRTHSTDRSMQRESIAEDAPPVAHSSSCRRAPQGFEHSPLRYVHADGISALVDLAL